MNALNQPYSKKSINEWFREKRFVVFLNLLKRVHKEVGPVTILDIGGTESYWESMHFTDNRDVHITLLNLDQVEVRHPNFSSVKGNACNLSAYQTGQFDIVYSNSVIEHLFHFGNQQKMAEEVRRVGRYYYIQTPNRYFPIEPHWRFPFFQFFPLWIRYFLTQHFSLGHIKKAGTRASAEKNVQEIQLLSEREMKQLFPNGNVYKEKFLGLTKSITSYHFPEV